MKTVKKAYIAMLFSFLYVPIAVMIFYSFNQSKSRTIFTGFTTNWYKVLFQDEMILKALGTTLFIALVSSIIATLIGTMAAVGIHNMRRAPKSIILAFTNLPVVNPEIITGVSLMLLFVFIKDITNYKQFLGLPTLLLAHITFNLPYVILSVMPKLRQMDTRLYEAALDLGCNPRQAFFKVVLPEIRPGIISGFLMAVTFSIDDFIISYFTAGTIQTLPIAIYSMTRKKVSPEINALSTIIFAVVLTVLLVMNYRDRAVPKRKKKVRG